MQNKKSALSLIFFAFFTKRGNKIWKVSKNVREEKRKEENQNSLGEKTEKGPQEKLLEKTAEEIREKLCNKASESFTPDSPSVEKTVADLIECLRKKADPIDEKEDFDFNNNLYEEDKIMRSKAIVNVEKVFVEGVSS